VNPLNSCDFTQAGDPLVLFQRWFEEARQNEPNDPEAMALASVDGEGMPDVRMVLCKDVDARGVAFYTNAQSAKGRQLLASPKAAALFHWKSLRRQIRLRGPVALTSEAEADAYFAGRARDSQLGAIASQQSRPLESRAALEGAVARLAATYGEGAVPRPAYWRGFRLTALAMEFWQDGAFRLHDRVLFSRDAPEAPWSRQRLYP